MDPITSDHFYYHLWEVLTFLCGFWVGVHWNDHEHMKAEMKLEEEDDCFMKCYASKPSEKPTEKY